MREGGALSKRSACVVGLGISLLGAANAAPRQLRDGRQCAGQTDDGFYVAFRHDVLRFDERPVGNFAKTLLIAPNPHDSLGCVGNPLQLTRVEAHFTDMRGTP